MQEMYVVNTYLQVSHAPVDLQNLVGKVHRRLVPLL